MNENHVAKQNSEEPSAVIPHARICGSTGGVIPGATRQNLLKKAWGFVKSVVPAVVCGTALVLRINNLSNYFFIV